MLIGFLNTWDAQEDYLDIYINGALAIHMTSNNSGGAGSDYDGGTLLLSNGQVDGVVNSVDALVDMATAPALTFAHSSSTLTLQIQASGAGWQGWPDEGWGLDDLSVTLTGAADAGSVPEPASQALLGLGLVGLAGMRRRQSSIKA